MLKLLIDMNLGSRLAELFRTNGYDCSYWQEVGDPSANDRELLTWAHKNRAILISSDLDFGEILAKSQSNSPSVIQIRRKQTRPELIFPILLNVLRLCEDVLQQGVFIVIGENRLRIRELPLKTH